jgi:sugar lactone lactonase YvrE
MRSFATFCTLLTISLLSAWAQQDVITTAIGGGPNDIPATDANLNQPQALAVDSAGNYYIAAYVANRVFKVDTSGTLTVLAGNGVAGDTGDTVLGGAANAELNGPNGVAVDSAGNNIYIGEYTSCVVRKVDTTTNTITTIAGIAGSCGYSGDNGPATSAKLNNPLGLALDTSGNLYIADYRNCRIRELVLATGTISTYAGNGTCAYKGEGVPATSAELWYPTAVAVDNAGDVIIGDLDSYRIREVTASTLIINTIAGTGTAGTGCPTGVATLTTIGRQYQGVAVDGAGTTVTFSDSTHNCVRQFAIGGSMSTIAGKGTAGFCGDGGLATSACLSGPQAVALASSGSIYVADNVNNRVRQFTVGGNINTVAGNGSPTFPTLLIGVLPQSVVFNDPIDVLVDPSGNVFISDSANCMVRELVKATGLVNIFAGSAASGATTGTCGFSGEGGAATSAELGTLGGIARDSSGNIYIADTSNCVVWQVNASTNDISIFAGVTPKKCGYNGDGGPATSAKLSAPAGIFVDSKNNLYISDSSNNVIREVTSGTINTIAGNGTAGYVGDGDGATAAELHDPTGVTVDSAGNVYIADNGNCVIREVTAATGIIATIAGNGTCNFNGDGPAVEHELNHPDRIRVDANGNLFIADDSGQRVRWVNSAGLMTTIAGNGKAGLSGDGGPATSAEFDLVGGIAQDASGNFLVADYDNLRIRGISVFTALNTSASSLDFGLVTVGSTGTPQVLTLSALGSLTFSNISISGPFTEYDNCGTSLSNAAACAMYVLFKPTAAGPETGTITIEDNGFFSGTTTISLEGTGSAISVTGPLLFGNQAVKTTSPPKTVTVTNKGTATVTMGTVTLNETDFAIAANHCTSGSTLVAGANCTISVVFKPKTTGAKKGALIINDSDLSSPQIVGMTGTGTSSVALSPSSVTFAPQPVGTTSNLAQITLTNNTAASLTFGSPAVSVTGPFKIGTGITSCSSSNPVSANGGTCFIYVEFMPTGVGYPTGTLSVFDSDTTSPQTVALLGTGTGVEMPPPVTLSSPVGKLTSTSVSIVNVGTSTITFTAATITGPNYTDFSTSNGDPPCGGSLAPGAFCNFTVSFTPSIKAPPNESATYLVYDNSPGSPQSLPLTGIGQ